MLMNLAAEDGESHARLAAFLQGLDQLGWTEGRNVRIIERGGLKNSRGVGRGCAPPFLGFHVD
jgi:hypothetical protein